MRAQANMEGKSLYAVRSRVSLERDLFLTGLGQLRNIHRNPPRLVSKLSYGSPPPQNPGRRRPCTPADAILSGGKGGASSDQQLAGPAGSLARLSEIPFSES
jgi:hypothetical protein